MIGNKRLFNVEDQIHSLLTSATNPNVLIPIRGIIKEIKHDLKNPLYLIKIVQFYDTWPFIKKYFLDNNYRYNFTDRPRPCKVKGVNSMDDIIEKLKNPDEENRYYIVVDSLMSFKFYYEMNDAYQMIQDFVIQKKMNELKEFQTRGSYKGKYKISSQKEWFIRARNIITESVSDNEFKKIIDEF